MFGESIGRSSKLLSLAAAGAFAAAVAVLETRRRQCKAQRKAVAVMKLAALSREEVPLRLRPEFYFDFVAHPFEHAELLTSAHDVIEVLGSLHKYMVEWLACHSLARDPIDISSPLMHRIVGDNPPVFLDSQDVGGPVFEPQVLIGSVDASGPEAPAHGLHVCKGVHVLGGTFDLRAGGIWLGEGVSVDPGVHIAGPAIIGRRTVLRPGVYIRGDVLVGDGAVLRGELKNTVIMDNAELAHPGYAGDSIIGWKGHFGCQSLTANLGLFDGELSLSLTDAQENLPRRYLLGRRKVGVVMGDECQLGCNTVTDPGTFMGPRTHIYPLTRLAAGVYGPDEIVKNRPELTSAIARVGLLRK